METIFPFVPVMAEEVGTLSMIQPLVGHIIFMQIRPQQIDLLSQIILMSTFHRMAERIGRLQSVKSRMELMDAILQAYCLMAPIS